MKNGEVGGLHLETTEDRVLALRTLAAAMLPLDIGLATDQETETFADLSIHIESLLGDDNGTFLNSEQAQTLKDAIRVAKDNFHQANGTLGCFSVMTGLSPENALIAMEASDVPVFNKAKVVVETGAAAIELSGTLELLNIPNTL